MDERTLTALNGSIAAWESRAAGNIKPATAENCPLCDVFFETRGELDGCEGCPVMERTGEDCCANTPCARYHPEFPTNTPEKLMAVAAEEVTFLKSLLPQTETEGEQG